MSETTKVIFRKFKDDDSVIALFPEIPCVVDKWWLCESYMHIGGHDAADYQALLNDTELATKDEYVGLLEELQKIGYENLEIRKRRTPQMVATLQNRWEESNETDQSKNP